MSGQAARVVGAGLALLAALALVAVAVVLLTRSDDAAPVRIVAPEATAVSEAAADIKVQVSGEVMKPGVYSMNANDRVFDAVAAAGGFGPNADLSGINFALRVQDEAHYYVPFFGETPPAPAASTSGGGVAEYDRAGNDRAGNGSASSLIDLNTASAQELEALPGIGPVMAGRIIAHRDANGPFAAIDDLENVPGIGPKTLEAIRQLVTVSGRP